MLYKLNDDPVKDFSLIGLAAAVLAGELPRYCTDFMIIITPTAA